ncbi:Fluconazole resistance protein 1 [Lecanora helva]
MLKKDQNHSDDASDGREVRKRVGKACQRCRLKKCKCDGVTPCTRCKSDDAICAYGKHKKSDKIVFRKGYVQMLERQQAQLIAGLQELYRRTQTGEGWTAPTLEPSHYGQPLTHKILEGLGLLRAEEWDERAHEGAPSWHGFEHQLQQGSGMVENDDDASVDMSPSNTVMTSPALDLSQAVFPDSTIMARRISKFQSPPTPVTQSLNTGAFMSAPGPVKPFNQVSSELPCLKANQCLQQDLPLQDPPGGSLFNGIDEGNNYNGNNRFVENRNLPQRNLDWMSMPDDMMNLIFPNRRAPMQVQ